MLLPFSIRVAELPVLESAVHSVNCTCLSWGFGQILCVSFFPSWY